MLAVCLTMGVPLSAAAQPTMLPAVTGTQAAASLQHALATIDQQTQVLMTLKNHIPSKNIIAVPTSMAGVDPRALARAMNTNRHAALATAAAIPRPGLPCRGIR